MGERTPVLVVTDAEKSAEFCTQVLGLEVVSGAPAWVFGLGEERVRLVETSRADIELGQSIQPGTTMVRLKADNIALLHERCQLHNAVAKGRRLKRTHWDTDEFIAEDPDGNRINFWNVSVT